MTSGRFLLLLMAIWLAIGIFFADFVAVPMGTIAILLVIATLSLVAYWLIRQGWGALFSLCLFFVIIGFLRAQFPDLSLIPPRLLSWSEQLSYSWYSHLGELGLNHDTTTLLEAMLLGNRANVPENVIQLYRQSGAAHVLALSGLHQGILFGGLNVLLMRLSNWRWRNAVGMAELTLMWGYALLTGFPVSLCRATLMMSLLVIGQIRLVGNDGWHTLGMAAFVLLMVSPSSLFDIGFQLSFAAVAGILLFYQPFVELGLPTQRAWRWLWLAGLVSLAAQSGVFPLLLHYFHRLSLTGFLLSPLYVLLATCIIYTALFFLFISLMGIGTGFLLRPLLEMLVAVQHGMMAISNHIPLSQVGDIYLPWGSVVLLYVALFCLLPVLKAIRHNELGIGHYRMAMFFRSWPYLLAVLLLLCAAIARCFV